MILITILICVINISFNSFASDKTFRVLEEAVKQQYYIFTFVFDGDLIV